MAIFESFIITQTMDHNFLFGPNCQNELIQQTSAEAGHAFAEKHPAGLQVQGK